MFKIHKCKNNKVRFFQNNFTLPANKNLPSGKIYFKLRNAYEKKDFYVSISKR